MRDKKNSKGSSRPNNERNRERDGKSTGYSKGAKSTGTGKDRREPQPLSPPRNLKPADTRRSASEDRQNRGKKTEPGFAERSGSGRPERPAPPSRTPKNADKTGGKAKKSTFEYRPKSKSRILKPGKPKPGAENAGVRLNKYIANAGICSRREADEMIKAGVVEINGQVVTEMGIRVQPGDEVKFEGQRLKTERNVYVLLNKPKDYITTLKDPSDRRTVMALVKNAAKERIYPVGRLDRNTTGLLLFTNDGELSTKLTHPRHGFKKIYHVHLDSNVKREHLTALLEGVELEDGFAKADAVEYVADAQDKSQVGIEIHIGRNRIVRRMFEHFGYKIKKLDRVYFAGLTKKDLPRGKWRLLTEQEVNMLKMLR